MTNVNQADGTFSVFIHLDMRWFDNNLKFVFLKNNIVDNNLNDSLIDQLWKPNYDFAFVDTRETIFKRLAIMKLGKPTLTGDIDQLHPLGL